MEETDNSPTPVSSLSGRIAELEAALKGLVDDLEMRSKNAVVDCSHGVYIAARAALEAGKLETGLREALEYARADAVDKSTAWDEAIKSGDRARAKALEEAAFFVTHFPSDTGELAEKRLIAKALRALAVKSGAPVINDWMGGE